MNGVIIWQSILFGKVLLGLACIYTFGKGGHSPQAYRISRAETLTYRSAWYSCVSTRKSVYYVLH